MVKLTMLWFRIYFCFLVIVLSCSFLHAPTFGTSTCWSYSIFVLVRGAIANSSVVAKAGLCQRGKLSLKEEHISNPTSLILKKWRRRRAKRWLYSRSHVIFFDETLLRSTMKAIYFVIVAILSFPTFGDAFTFFPSAKTSGVVTSTPLEWNCLMFRKKLLLMRRCVYAFHVVCAHVCVCAFLRLVRWIVSRIVGLKHGLSSLCTKATVHFKFDKLLTCLNIGPFRPAVGAAVSRKCKGR